MNGIALRRFRRAVKYSPFPSAARFHVSTARFKGFSGPVGSGKTLAVVHEGLKLAYLNRGCTGVIGAPTYRLLHDVTRQTFLDVLEENEVPYEPHWSDNEIYLPECEHTVRFRSLSEPHRLIGPNLAWFGCDELSYCEEDAWRRLIARLREPKAKRLCGFGGWTPNGLNWTWEKFISEDRTQDYVAVLAEPYENIAILSKTPDYYERLKQNYDARFYEQEVLGRYLEVFAGTVYWAFADDNKRRVEYDRRYPICWTIDFNVDPFSSLLAQIIPIGETHQLVHVIDEIALPNAHVVDMCEEMVNRVEGWSPGHGRLPLRVYGDPAGEARDAKTVGTDWDEVRKNLRRFPEFEVTWKVGRSAPLVKDRVNVVNGLLLNADGQRRMFINPRCRELIKDFRQVSWKADPAGNLATTVAKSDPKRTHLSDAVGYLCWEEFRAKGKAEMVAELAF